MAYYSQTFTEDKTKLAPAFALAIAQHEEHAKRDPDDLGPDPWLSFYTYPAPGVDRDGYRIVNVRANIDNDIPGQVPLSSAKLLGHTGVIWQELASEAELP